jgi:hypothetical protein
VLQQAALDGALRGACKVPARHEIGAFLDRGSPPQATSELEAHVTTLFARMGAASRTEAVSAAFRRGLMTVHDGMHETPA